MTISFNQIKYLKACIDSILTQSGIDLEYIVVDPGSTDGSRELINTYDEQIIKVFESDVGPADGLNKGFSHASGDIYGFINSDDYLLPDALKSVVDFFSNQNQPNTTFVTGHGYIESSDGARTVVFPNTLTVSGMLQLADIVFQQSTFFPASLFKKVGGFNAANRTCWDYELFLRFLLAGSKHQIIPEALAVFRLYEESISGSGHLEEKCLQDVDHLFLEINGRKRSFIDTVTRYYLLLKRELIRKLMKIAKF